MNFTKLRLYPILSVIFLTSTIFIFSGCSKNSSMVDPPTAGGSNAMIGLLATTPVNNNIIQLTGAKFLIKEIEMETFEDHDDELILEGPIVVGIDLQSQTAQIAAGNLNPGTFHEIIFEIHKPAPNESVPDPDFIDGPGESHRFSFVISGTFNGTPFVFKSPVSAREEIELDSLVTVTAANQSFITINVSPIMWFESNGTVLNPMDPANREIIDQNIRSSFNEAFGDDEGHHHHGHHHHEGG